MTLPNKDQAAAPPRAATSVFPAVTRGVGGKVSLSISNYNECTAKLADAFLRRGVVVDDCVRVSPFVAVPPVAAAEVVPLATRFWRGLQDSPDAVLQTRVRITWTDGIYDGVITERRPNGKYRVLYDDGDIRDYTLEHDSNKGLLALINSSKLAMEILSVADENLGGLPAGKVGVVTSTSMDGHTCSVLFDNEEDPRENVDIKSLCLLSIFGANIPTFDMFSTDVYDEFVATIKVLDDEIIRVTQQRQLLTLRTLEDRVEVEHPTEDIASVTATIHDQIKAHQATVAQRLELRKQLEAELVTLEASNGRKYEVTEPPEQVGLRFMTALEEHARKSRDEATFGAALTRFQQAYARRGLAANDRVRYVPWEVKGAEPELAKKKAKAGNPYMGYYGGFGDLANPKPPKSPEKQLSALDELFFKAWNADQASVVHSRLRITWRDGIYDGAITNVLDGGKFRVLYDDGDVRIYTLRRKGKGLFVNNHSGDSAAKVIEVTAEMRAQHDTGGLDGIVGKVLTPSLDGQSCSVRFEGKQKGKKKKVARTIDLPITKLCLQTVLQGTMPNLTSFAEGGLQAMLTDLDLATKQLDAEAVIHSYDRHLLTLHGLEDRLETRRSDPPPRSEEALAWFEEKLQECRGKEAEALAARKKLEEEWIRLGARQGLTYEPTEPANTISSAYFATLHAHIDSARISLSCLEKVVRTAADEICRLIHSADPFQIFVTASSPGFAKDSLDDVARAISQGESGEEEMANVDLATPGLQTRCDKRVGFWKEMLRDMFDCQICLEPCRHGSAAIYGLFDSIGFQCRHYERICKGCVEHQLENALKDASYVTEHGLKCHHPECQDILRLDKLHALWYEYKDKAKLAKITDFMLSAAIEKDPTSRWCANYHVCKSIARNKSSTDFGTCDQCDAKSCLKCDAHHHPGKTCEEVSDAGFKEFAKEKELKQCPKCAFWVEKKDGCDAMHCRCNLVFCYRCTGVRVAKGTPYKQCSCPGVEALLRAHDSGQANHNLY